MGNRHFDSHLRQVAVDRDHKQKVQSDGNVGNDKAG